MIGMFSTKKSPKAKKAAKGGKKMTKAELSAMGKKITARAKQLYKGKTKSLSNWRKAMSQAGKEFKGK
jgi:hypothetical protein